MLPRTTESVARKTLFYGIITSTTKETEYGPMAEVEQTQVAMCDKISFINRAKMRRV